MSELPKEGAVPPAGPSQTSDDTPRASLPRGDLLTLAEAVDELPFVPTDFQRAILRALDGRALKKQQLADEVCGGHGSRLYRPGGLKELMELGIVVNKPGAGYYRPDRPPTDW